MTRSPITDEEAWQDAKRAGYTPDTKKHPGTPNKWPGTCDSCGDPVAPRYNNVRSGHMACKKCHAGSVAGKAKSDRCPTCNHIL